MREAILHGMAEIFWGINWADHAEEHDCCNLSGVEITHVMPEIPAEVHAFVAEVAAKIEKASGATLEAIFEAAMAADDSVSEDDAERFGNCLAYKHDGHGVSWEDDHDRVEGLVVPYGESSELRFVADRQCEEDTNYVRSAWCGCYLDRRIGARYHSRCEHHGDTHAWPKDGGPPLYVPDHLKVYYHKLQRNTRWRGTCKRVKAESRFMRLLRAANK